MTFVSARFNLFEQDIASLLILEALQKPCFICNICIIHTERLSDLDGKDGNVLKTLSVHCCSCPPQGCKHSGQCQYIVLIFSSCQEHYGEHGG